MNFTIDAGALRRTVGRVQRVVERRNTIPILANIVLSAKDGRLSLRATDLDLEITETVEADIETEGETTVHAATLNDIARKLPEDSEVIIQSDEGQVKMRSGRSRFTLHTLPISDFPDLTIGEFPTTFTMKAGDLKRLLGKVQFAISTEETRYYLNGIYFHPFTEGNRKLLRLVATDGHRLAQAQADAPAGAEEFTGVIVPRKTIGEIDKLLEPADAEATIELSDTKIRLSIGNVVLTSKLIDGTFPDYQRVVPQGNDKLLLVDRGDLRAAVDRVQTVSSERGRAVKMALDSGKLTLECINPDSGSATEEMGVEYADEAMSIGFNSRYLLDLTAQLSTEIAEVKLADPGSPTLIRDKDDADALFVLMPMRV